MEGNRLAMYYRKASIKDIDQLIELRKKLLIEEGFCSDNNIDEELEQYFSLSITNREMVIWLALDAEYIIGTAGVCFFQYPPSFSNPTGKIAYITNVYTREEYRNQGVATKLLDFILDEVKMEGCQVTRLHASAQGRKLYEKKGFVDAEGFMKRKMS